jgi:antitoxin ParD1/3/4
MMIQLSEEHQQLVRSLMEDGGFASEDEVIDTALRLLQEHDEQAMIAELRREVAIGLEEADRGELAPFDPLGTLERIRARQSSGERPS